MPTPDTIGEFREGTPQPNAPEEMFKFKENALDIIDALEKSILNLMLDRAEIYAKGMPLKNGKRVITITDMKKILANVLDEVSKDGRFVAR